MSVKLSPNTAQTLEAYAADRLDIRELAAWLAQAAYDADIPAEERDELARVDLVLTEVLEDLRPQDEVATVVNELLHAASVAPHARSI